MPKRELKYGEADYHCKKCGKHITRSIMHHCEDNVKKVKKSFGNWKCPDCNEHINPIHMAEHRHKCKLQIEVKQLREDRDLWKQSESECLKVNKELESKNKRLLENQNMQSEYIIKLEAEKKELRDAFKIYGQHFYDCDIIKFAGKITDEEIDSMIEGKEYRRQCTCGFHKAIKE